MISSDLRIGNLLYSDRYKREVEVTAIEQTGVKVYGDFFIEGAYNLKPIPLDEDWLIKFGFEYSDEEEMYLNKYIQDIGSLYFSKYDYIIRIEIYSRRNTSVPFRHVKHVHKLQNLYYSLTGEELKIKE